MPGELKEEKMLLRTAAAAASVPCNFPARTGGQDGRQGRTCRMLQEGEWSGKRCCRWY